MRRLTKDEPNTLSNGSQSPTPPFDLDQVVASVQLQFKQFGGADVSVCGWPKEDTVQKQDKRIEDSWDQALLFFEVQKVYEVDRAWLKSRNLTLIAHASWRQ